MKPPEIVLASALSFVAGVLCASFGMPLLYTAIPTSIVFAIVYILGAHAVFAVGAAFLLMFGGWYYAHDEGLYQARVSGAQNLSAAEGRVITDPKHDSAYQSFTLKTPQGNMSVLSEPYPEYEYGDELSVSGKSSPPDAAFEHGKHIVGTFNKPDIVLESRGNGNPVLAFLYDAKHSIRAAYEKLLPQDQASLLYGIIFGANERLSPGLKQNLELSGLRFMTAIDGLHMQIVMLILFAVVASFAPLRIAAFVAALLAFGFVGLTGFTISGIRAALMAGIASLARYSGRTYLPGNALALVACVLLLINPQVLRYDAGFQLSFVAVLSILYLMPVLRHLFRFGEDFGFLGWKESLLITLSVQLATAPIVISQFQTFSLTAFMASVLVVWLLPFLISGGFLLALAALWKPAGLAVAFVMHHILSYLEFVINLFGKYAVPFNPEVGLVAVTAYYTALGIFLVWFYTRPAVSKEKPVLVPKTGYTIIEVE